jgi:hypothetical protein
VGNLGATQDAQAKGFGIHQSIIASPLALPSSSLSPVIK